MKHYGDITKLSGHSLPIVDVITGGSPCQDLSVAGKRAGLDGERSGLFMEQVRIVKEMRENDRRMGRTGYLVRPRYLVWENVPGAFSSNSGRDFQAVLTEITRVTEPEAPDVPLPEKGKWSKSGCIYDELGNWSIAWTVHNAAEWGVPQRRIRISLVADFAGLSAPEILFERKGLCGDSAPCGESGQGASKGTEDSSGSTVYSLQGGGVTSQNSQGSNINEDVSFTLNALDRHGVAYGFEPGAAKRLNPEERFTEEVAPTLRANMGDNQTAVACSVYENHSQDSRYNPLGEICETVSAKYGTGGNNMPMVVEPTVSAPMALY